MIELVGALIDPAGAKASTVALVDDVPPASALVGEERLDLEEDLRDSIFVLTARDECLDEEHLDSRGERRDREGSPRALEVSLRAYEVGLPKRAGRVSERDPGASGGCFTERGPIPKPKEVETDGQRQIGKPRVIRPEESGTSIGRAGDTKGRERACAPDAAREVLPLSQAAKRAFDRPDIVGERARARELFGDSRKGAVLLDEPVDILLPGEAVLSGIRSGRFVHRVPNHRAIMNASFLLVVDLEATCDDTGTIPRFEMETIEIGAVLLAIGTFQPVAELATFVRPVRHPILSRFCRELTTIQQTDVDRAPRFPEAFAQLRGLVMNHGGPSEVLFASWGDYDKNQLRQDVRYHHLGQSGWESGGFDQHLNLKRAFSETVNMTKKLGMRQALARVNLEPLGTHHRGIDDARNIARLAPFIIGCRSASRTCPSNQRRL